MKFLWLARLFILALLIIVSFKPVMVRPDPGLPSSWAVLLDSSRSMGVKDPKQRFEIAKALVPDILKKFPRFSPFVFSNDVEPLDIDNLEKLKPNGKKSNLANALKKVFEGNQYRGAVILTDGKQVGQGDAVGQAASVGRPLLMVGFGNRDLFKDISVKRIQSPPFAFKNVPTSLTAVVSAVGFAGKKITVRLRQKGKILGIQTLQVSSNEIESSVTFNWTPTSLGTKVLTVEVDQYSGEFTTKNNKKRITLDVGRDRFRVLYICGMPGPEYGFLRHQFKSDPAVELVTFVILRNASNVVNVPDAELSLIPFPSQNVLINQLATFDLIVFEEFSYQRFGLPPTVLHAIRKKVEDGGSFLMMGGQIMFGRGSPYAVQGIKEMIPIEFGLTPHKTVDGPLQLKAKAPNHPIMRLVQNRQRNEQIWKGLPKVEEITLIEKTRSGATILATVSSGGKEYPVLTAWKHKKGRVATLSTRTTWRFSTMGETPEGGSYVYQQFWKNMVLWLTHSDEFKSVRVALENRSVRLGEEEQARVWVYDEYFKPISDVDVRMQIIGPNNESQDLMAHQETKGVFSTVFKGSGLGEHKIKAWVLRKGKKIGQDRVRFDVVEGFYEDEDLRSDFDNMKEMAEVTGGQFVTAGEFSIDAFDEFNKEIGEKVGRKVLVWNSPWFFGILILFFIVEWYFRKKRGLP